MLAGIILAGLATVMVLLLFATFEPEFEDPVTIVAGEARHGDSAMRQGLVSEFYFSFDASGVIFSPSFALVNGAVATSVGFGAFFGVFAMRRLLPDRSRAELPTLVVLACQLPVALGPAFLAYKLYGIGVALFLVIAAFMGSALGAYLAYNFRMGEDP